MSDRLPPNSRESEQGVLGCVMVSPQGVLPDCIEAFCGLSGVFYDLRHQTIYDTMLSLFEDSIPIDLITLSERLKETQRLEQVGGIPYLASLADTIPSAANISYYLTIVKDKWVSRRMIQVCTEAIGRAFEQDGDIESLLGQLEQEVLAIRPARQKKSATIKELVKESLLRIEKLWEQKGAIEGIPTGLIDLDKMTGGLHEGEMTVVAGYPGAGKTSLAMNITERAMLESKKCVGVFSLEMSNVSIVTRFICSHARVSLGNVRDGFLTEGDFSKIAASAGKISNAAIYFDDESDLSIYQLRAKARRMKQQHGIDLLIVDYIQLLSAIGGARKLENRQQEVADISRGIKAIARELKIPVIALSQLNDDGKLYQSRAIGQDADNVWILRSDSVDEENEHADAKEVTLEIKKQRMGKTGKIELTFLRPYTRFESRAKVSDNDVPRARQPYND